MTTYKLTYFEARGAVEPSRLVFVVAGKEFKDDRVKREDWPKLKPSTPMKAMPLLTVSKGGKDTVYCQSGSIARYLAKQFGLFGSSPEEEFAIDEVCEGLQDTLRDMYKFAFEQDATKKAEQLKKFQDESLPKFGDYITNRSKLWGKNGFVVGSKLSLADIAVFNFVNNTKLHKHDDWWTAYPAINKHYDLVKSNKNIAKWLESRPKSDF